MVLKVVYPKPKIKLMLQSIEGIYKDGKIELTETPTGINTARVIVTFLDTNASVDLSSRGINEEQAAKLRTRLQCFAQDWDQPEMEVYDAL